MKNRKLPAFILVIAIILCCLTSMSVCAVNYAGNSSNSTTKTEETLELEAPKEITASQTKTTVTLKWSKVAGATHYRVYQKTSSGWEYLGYTKELTETIKDLKSGTKYIFAVQTCTKNGVKTIPGNSKQIQTATKPSTPTKITATQTTSTITLKWNSVRGATGYRVYVYNSKTQKYVHMASVRNNTTYKVSNLKSGTNYKFKIRPYIKYNDVLVWGDYSSAFATMTKASTPTIESASQSKNTITLNWNKVTGATGYRVYMYNTKTKKYNHIASVRNDTSYKVSKLKTGTIYKFKVRPYIKYDGDVIWSSYSSVFETATKPVAPSEIVAKSTDNSVTLKWSKVSGATEYKIYQKTSSGWKTLCSTTETTSTIKSLTYETKYTFAVKPCIKTKSDVVAGNYSEITVKTKERDNYVETTDAGLKLYEVTSDEAKKIIKKWSLNSSKCYESKSSDGKILVYWYTYSGWCARDLSGAGYDSSGDVKICYICNKILGEGDNHCTGACRFTFT